MSLKTKFCVKIHLSALKMLNIVQIENIEGNTTKILEDKLIMKIKVKIRNIYETKLNTTCTNT